MKLFHTLSVYHLYSDAEEPSVQRYAIKGFGLGVSGLRLVPFYATRLA